MLVVEQALRRHQFEDVDPVQVPAVRSGGVGQLLRRLRKGDIEAALAGRRAGHQELQGEGGLAGAGLPFDQIKPVPGEAAVQRLVQSLDSKLHL